MKKRSRIAIICSLLLAAAAICCVLLVVRGKKPQPSGIERPIDTPTQDEVTIRLDGLDREYRIAWISDLHIISDLMPAEDIKEDQIATIRDRYENLFVTNQGVHSKDLWEPLLRYVNEQKFDALILGGDILDYCSQNNLNALEDGIGKIDASIPVLYLRSDHDYGWWYSGDVLNKKGAMKLHATQTFDQDAMDAMKLDLGEFVILGIDRSCWNLSPRYMRWLKKEYRQAEKEKKQVLIATHVPFGSQTDDKLEQFSLQERDKRYYWGGDYEPDETTKELIQMIEDKDTIVKEVLAGHMHASYDGPITDQVRQHIFAPAYEGTIGIIHVIP